MTDEFETELRTMLRERATDITTLPAHVAEFDALEPTGTRLQLRAHWLIAAAVVAVLAIAGAIWAVGPGKGNHKTPPATSSPTVVHSTPPPATGHATRKVSLNWFEMAKVPGYTRTLLMSDPAYRMIELLHAHETSAPPGCNGCGQKSAQVFVFGRGKFDAQAQGILELPQTDFAGHHAYLGKAHWYPGGKSRPKVATLAWQYGADEWAMVQGLTPLASTHTALVQLAEAARPATNVPIALPFTLDYVPSVPITEVYDNRPAGYTFSLNLGTALSITMWNGPVSTYFDPRQAGVARRSIGGVLGYYSPDGAAVEYRGTAVGFDVIDPSLTTEPADLVPYEHELVHILDGLHWAPTPVPAERAIP